MPDPTQGTSARPAPPDVSYQFLDRFATAFDEVAVLREMGREGWD